jgi:type II secretory pathway component GspD/PulD (secretin)
MKKILLFILVVLFFIPAGISARDYAYNSNLSSYQRSSDIFSDDILGDYFLFSKEQRISLDLEDARLVDVLKMLSQQTGLNFISTEAVRDRRITLYIQNTPFKKAMDIIFRANNLSYNFYPESEMFVVKEMGKPEIELKTKVYYLKYTRLKTSKMQQDIDDRLEDDEEDSGGSDDDEDDYGIKDAVEKVLTAQGRVSEDPITNALIVTDVPSRFPMIDQVVDKLDTAPIQVIIEAEILDVDKSLLDEMGFNWGDDIGQGLTAAFAPVVGPVEIANKFLIQSGSYAGKSIFSGGTMDFSDTTAAINFLRKDTKTKFLARPKILTLSNQTAVVNLITDAVVGVKITTDESGNVTQEVTRDDIGTRLRVTPQVNPHTNEITMFLELFNKNATNSGFELGGGANITGVIQDVEERGTKQTIRLSEGETLFLGGLIEEEEQEIVSKVPLLGDIPLLGALFRYRQQPENKNSQRELMVFLTPRIIKDKAFTKRSNDIAFLEREQLNPEKEFAVESILNKHMNRR